jgi:hypothetical protein
MSKNSDTPQLKETAVLDLAMKRFSYYPCSRCDNVFFGGEPNCGEQADEEDSNREAFNPEELVCGACSSEGTTTCPTHGTEYVEFKCRFCCAPRVATFFCGGTTHFCSGALGVGAATDQSPLLFALGGAIILTSRASLAECHKKGWGATAQPCNPNTCIFGGRHPSGAANGKDEYSLGCGLCRNLKDR